MRPDRPENTAVARRHPSQYVLLRIRPVPLCSRLPGNWVFALTPGLAIRSIICIADRISLEQVSLHVDSGETLDVRQGFKGGLRCLCRPVVHRRSWILACEHNYG